MLLGEMIREWRSSYGFGIRDVAKEIGISHATLSRIEAGRACDSTSLARVMIFVFADEAKTQRRKPKRAKSRMALADLKSAFKLPPPNMGKIGRTRLAALEGKS